MLFSCIRLALNADLIHANWSLNGVIAGIAGLATKTPVVTTLRGSDVTRLETSRVSMLVTHLCLRLNTNIICVSEAIHANVRKHFPQYENKLQVIPNGVDHEFLQLNRIERGPEHPFRLLFVGNLIPLKAAHFVIEALADPSISSKTELVLVGDGPQKARLQSLIESLDLRTKVSFIGAVAPDEMVEWFVKASGLVLSSLSEGRPNVVLEAMASGLPVIASRIEGVTELVQENVTGFAFNPGDVHELARCIAALADDPRLCLRLGQAGRRFILENELTWEHSALRYSELYRTIMTARNPSELA
jgi:glycosyltransferase involved in cell wall biosynthesis